MVVVDLFGKITDGTFGGDNLHTAIYIFTKTGFVIDGAIRDLGGVMRLDYIPIRIGAATVMPGDVVFGDREGVYFIPPHLVEEIVKQGQITHIHDEWTKAKLLTGKYKSSDLYPAPSDPVLKREYEDYLKKRLAE